MKYHGFSRVRALLGHGAQEQVLMFSRPLAFLLLALATITAAAGGAYVATRHNVADPPATVAPAAPAAAQATSAAAQPVAATEAPVTSGKPEDPKPETTTAVSPKPTAAPSVAPRRAEPAAPKKTATPPAQTKSAQHTSAPASHPGSANSGSPVTQPDPQPAVT